MPDVFDVMAEPVADLESKFEPISDFDSKPLLDVTALLRRVSIRLPIADPALLLESRADAPTVLPVFDTLESVCGRNRENQLIDALKRVG